MIRLILGLALLPTAALTVYSAAHVLGVLFAQVPSAWPFLAGASAAAGLWLLGLAAEGRGRTAGARLLRALRWIYVFGHEFTHVLAAWAVGGKVHAMEVTSDGGHVDLSHSNAFISLAPYCVPIYTVLVVLGYRTAQWLCPGRLGLGVFLALMGVTLAGHLLMTGECLWQRRQPDLAAAGGLLFSLSVIAICNGLVVMLLSKALFPRAVAVAGPLRQTAEFSAAFWSGGYGLLKSFLGPIGKGYRP
ncbi:MAG: M50 family metallopeptidase [Elusimicrobia bacterium]|nr:M50 family metallopeptidase [Elusimicrobiota bacterium]